MAHVHVHVQAFDDDNDPQPSTVRSNVDAAVVFTITAQEPGASPAAHIDVAITGDHQNAQRLLSALLLGIMDSELADALVKSVVEADYAEPAPPKPREHRGSRR